MGWIEVTDEVKKILDHYVEKHNQMVRNHPKSVAAFLGEKTHSDIIMWLHQEVFRSRESSMSDKDFGRP